jgi:hypothetical protein
MPGVQALPGPPVSAQNGYAGRALLAPSVADHLYERGAALLINAAYSRLPQAEQAEWKILE